jgi:hypothetical protein
MKKTILTIAVVSALNLSCKKDEPCNCGIIQSDNAQNYSVVIKNECSDNNKEFVLSQGDWMNAYVGSRYCITNSGKW